MVGWLRRRWFAVGFVAALMVADLVAWALSSAWQERVVGWASTNVVNLEHHPIGALVVSAFVGGSDQPVAWPVLALMGLLTADRLLGPARTALLCGSAHVVGTLISEGVVAYRVHAGALPGSALSQVDVGPSYVVVAALTLAVLAGSWRRRLVALAGLLALSPYLFTGLSRLDVAAVGHTVSVLLGAAAAVAYQQNRAHRRLRAAPAAPGTPAATAVPAAPAASEQPAAQSAAGFGPPRLSPERPAAEGGSPRA
jgi:hypothetical protein